MSCTLLALFEDVDSRVIPWVARIVAAAGNTLAVLCVSKDPARRFDQVVEEAEGMSDLVRASLEAVDESSRGRVEFYDCRGPKLRRAVLDAARELDAKALIMTTRVEGDDLGRSAVHKLTRVAPQDVFVLDLGDMNEMPSRVLIPQFGGGGSFAIRLGARSFAGADCPVVALADPQALPRSKRVFGKARDKAAEARREACVQEEVEGALTEAVTERLTDGDLVIVDADESRRVAAMLSVLRGLREKGAETTFAVGLSRAAEAAGPGRVERALERVRLHFPTLDRDQRRSLVETLERGGSLSADFMVMLMLSAAIAAFGLVQSSAGVVIGAMLVAPLMTPLVAAGMALVQANQQLFRASIIAMTSGIAGALVASGCVGLLSPWGDLSSEIVARGGPNVFDMAIALLSGCAAAFALARPGLAGTLVGVAIAVALVPPLASVALATVKGEFGIAGGAALLFLTNLLAIIGGAALVFRLFGLDAARRGQPFPAWVRLTFAGLIVGLIPITVVLVRNLNIQVRQGVQRPWARPLAPGLRGAIRERVARSPGIEVVLMAQSVIERGFGMQIVLACSRPMDPGLERDLRELTEESGGGGMELLITALAVASPASGE